MPRKKKTDVEAELLKEVTQEIKRPQTSQPKEIPEQAPPKDLALNDLKVGYVVGISPEGNLIFEVFGKEKGLIDLLGLHQLAEFRLNRIMEDTQMSGDRLTHEVGKAVALINQKLDLMMQTLIKDK